MGVHTGMVVDFRNEPLVDFGLPGNSQAMEEAIARVEAALGGDYDLIIGGERIRTTERVRSLNPSNLGQTVGFVAKATRDHAERAIQTATRTFASWRKTPADVRAACLFKAAAIMRRRKLELAAWEIFEAGKTWVEADADVAEAIDFLEFYAREMLRLSERQPVTPFVGEANQLLYLPLGVGVIIPPWNFPLAILAGMTTSAVVAGNTVVLKPASAAPVTGAKFMEVMEEAGIPDGVINFVPGSGSEIGDFLVAHPKTRFVSFTGSRDVGLRINELAAKHQPGQIWLKRAVLEMGGKDAIIVDRGVDPKEAATGIVASAFGFQGQKCSACSRAIVVADLYDAVLTEVAERTKDLVVGQSKEFTTQVGPVVDQAAYDKILGYIDVGKREGRLMTGGGKAPGNGYFIEPTVFADVDPRARIAQEEIFGPVLTFLRAHDFDHALEIANGTEYGLTGSIYSRDREHLARAAADFHVGNLYFNRKCTGALVGVHPFGGFNMSGTDSKTGGRDYLLLFLQAKSISEKL